MAIAVAFPNKTFSSDGRNNPASELNTMRPSFTFVGFKTVSTNATDIFRLSAFNVKYNKHSRNRNKKEDRKENVRELQGFTAVEGLDGQYDLQSFREELFLSDSGEELVNHVLRLFMRV